MVVSPILHYPRHLLFETLANLIYIYIYIYIWLGSQQKYYWCILSCGNRLLGDNRGGWKQSEAQVIYFYYLFFYVLDLLSYSLFLRSKKLNIRINKTKQKNGGHLRGTKVFWHEYSRRNLQRWPLFLEFKNMDILTSPLKKNMRATNTKKACFHFDRLAFHPKTASSVNPQDLGAEKKGLSCLRPRQALPIPPLSCLVTWQTEKDTTRRHGFSPCASAPLKTCR